METKLKDIRDYLYTLQDYVENNTDNKKIRYQSYQLCQRIRTLLNIYQQSVEQGVLFDEDYLKKYL